MAKAAKLTDLEQVTEHINKLEAGLGKIIQTMREIILSTDRKQIKWNNPSFIIQVK